MFYIFDSVHISLAPRTACSTQSYHNIRSKSNVYLNLTHAKFYIFVFLLCLQSLILQKNCATILLKSFIKGEAVCITK